MHPLILATTILLALPAAATAQDWSGAYAGLSAGRGQGDLTVVMFGDVYPIEGSQYGAFVGYNLQQGNLVFGGELAYSRADIAITTIQDQRFDRFVDLKARLGYAAGKALYYGLAGLTWDDFDVGTAASPGDGSVIGLGVDYQLSDRLFLGAEYLHRSVENESTLTVLPIKADVDTVSVRLGLRF